MLVCSKDVQTSVFIDKHNVNSSWFRNIGICLFSFEVWNAFSKAAFRNDQAHVGNMYIDRDSW